MAFYTVAICDQCGNTIYIKGVVTKRLLVFHIREREGWTVGKKHLCEKCRKPPKISKGAAV